MKNVFTALGVLLISLISNAQQVAKGLTASNGEFIGFYEYKPTDYTTSTKYPVIIFLHGIGERGNGTTELSRVLGNGTPREIQNGHTMRFYWNGKYETFLVLTPQLNGKYGWWPTFYVEEMINYANKNLSIDPNRIFLAGLSLGGGGVWSYPGSSLANAQKLAGIAPACGTCQNLDWCNIAKANLPVWAFHAADDGTVGVGCTNGAISAIENCNPAVKPYKTIWPSGQHWIWGRVFNTQYEAQHPNIYEWFLGQDKSKPVNNRPVANAGPDQTVITLTGSATLDASRSTDADGKILRYVWTKVSGPSYGNITNPVSTSPTTTVTGLSLVGTYVYEVRVIDDRADWTVDQVTINVVSTSLPQPTTNKPPIASAGPDVTLTLPANSTTLNGSGSSDPDGYLTAYSWSKVSGPSQFTLSNSSASSTTVSNLVEGTYTFRLTVKDNNDASVSDDVTITVKAATSNTTTNVANAGSDINLTLPTNSTMLDGSASADPTGSVKAYEWSKVSGPAQYAIANASAATTALNNLAEGTYYFRLRVWDNNWNPANDTVMVVVKSGTSGGGSNNTTGKIANAGPDISITLPANSATLDGSASSDPSGNAFKAYEWRKISGPSQHSIANTKSLTTTVSGLAEGTYQFELRVWNYLWQPKADTMVLTVKGSTSGSTTPPSDPSKIANAGPDITITLPANSVTLDGSASADPDGKPFKTQEWKMIDGPSQYTIANPKSLTTTASGLVQGVYKFELRVWLNNWQPKADTMLVFVKGTGSTTDPNKMANAGPDVYITLPVNSTTLDGSASADPEGKPFKTQEWKKISGPSQYTIANTRSLKTSVSNLAQGVYEFELRVWNSNWQPKSDTMLVIVLGSSAITSASSGTTQAMMSTNITPEAMAQEAAADKLLVYPNPAHGLINVQCISEATGNTVINIYDVNGKNVQKVTFSKEQSLQQRSLNITRLAPGVYHLEVMIDGKKRMISKFIKQ